MHSEQSAENQRKRDQFASDLRSRMFGFEFRHDDYDDYNCKKKAHIWALIITCESTHNSTGWRSTAGCLCIMMSWSMTESVCEWQALVAPVALFNSRSPTRLCGCTLMC